MALRVRLPERAAQRVVLVKAFEEVDVEGRVLPLEARREASREVLGGQPAPTDPVVAADALARRAERLEAKLSEATKLPRNVASTLRLGGAGAVALPLVALVAGLLASALGTDRNVHLLAVPLLGTFAWNLFTYFSFLGVWLLKGRSGGPPGDALGRIFAPLASFVAARRAAAQLRQAPARESAVVGPALARFLKAWRAAAAALLAARGRRLLHAGALLFTVGLVAGTYFRGLAFEYRATWESTFLEASTVERLFDILLTPASRLAAIPIPDVAALQAPATGPAAPWIHLFAVTAALLVGLPRSLFFLAETLRILRLRRRVALELGGAYARRVLAAGRGDGLTVDIVPYGERPAARERERLSTALLDVFGSRCHLRRWEPLAAGAPLDSAWNKPATPRLSDGAGDTSNSEIGDGETSDIELSDIELSDSELSEAEPNGAETNPGDTSSDDAPWERATVVWFGLAATPEDEVHGDALRVAQQRGTALAVVDATRYAQRLGRDAGERLETRRRAWNRLARQLAVPLAHVHLADDDPDTLHRSLSAALDAGLPSESDAAEAVAEKGGAR